MKIGDKNLTSQNWYKYQVQRKPNGKKTIAKVEASFTEVFEKAMREREMIDIIDQQRAK